MNENSQVTIKDIARIAGVSFSTVSRCLNNSSEASEKTKRKVQLIARDLGFEFNASARGLITSQVGTVAIILPEDYTKANVNSYHSMMINRLRTSLEEGDVDLIVSFEKNHFTGENNVIRLVNRKKIDGLIILNEFLDDDSLTFLSEKDIPSVFIHYPPTRKLQNLDVIYSDNYTGGRLAAEKFLEKGRDRFIIISNSDHLEFRLREQGFCEYLESKGYPVTRLYSDTSFEQAIETVKDNLHLFRDCNGLFTVNDLTAFGAMNGLISSGYTIPEDISVIGYDDTEYAKYSIPSLTTIHQPKEEMANLACDRLFKQISKQKDNEKIIRRRISIDPILVERDSV